MKYKVGDVVRVKTVKELEKTCKKIDFDCYQCGQNSFVKRMSVYCGQLLEITNVNEYHYYTTKGNYWHWTDEMFSGLLAQTELDIYKKALELSGKQEELLERAKKELTPKEKIHLTKTERIILRNLDKAYKWIARDCCGRLCIYKTKPTKHSAVWEASFDKLDNFSFFGGLFQFIKWEDDEPYEISKLLEEG